MESFASFTSRQMQSPRHNKASLRDIILPKLQNLSPALRDAADYVLKNPNAVAMRSLRQVAELSGLKPPTYTRLAQSLGFRAYEELRELCRQDMVQSSTSISDKALALQQLKGGGPGSFLSRHAAASINNIEKLSNDLDLSALSHAADELARAQSVVLVGALSSASLIDYLGYMAQMAFKNWRTSFGNHETVGVALRDIGPKDMVVVLTFEPYASRAVETAKRAHDAGIPTLVVTDGYTAPVAAYASHLFVVPTDSPHFFASAASLIVFFESLVSMVVRRGGKKTRDRIAAIEKENHEAGEYWKD